MHPGAWFLRRDCRYEPAPIQTVFLNALYAFVECAGQVRSRSPGRGVAETRGRRRDETLVRASRCALSPGYAAWAGMTTTAASAYSRQARPRLPIPLLATPRAAGLPPPIVSRHAPRHVLRPTRARLRGLLPASAAMPRDRARRRDRTPRA